MLEMAEIFCIIWIKQTLQAHTFSSYNIVQLTHNYLTGTVYYYVMKNPSGHTTFIQRRLNVDATSWRCIDVEVTLYRRRVSAGMSSLYMKWNAG